MMLVSRCCQRMREEGTLLTDLSTGYYVQRHGFKGNILSREISVNRIRLLSIRYGEWGKTASLMSNDTKTFMEVKRLSLNTN